MDLNYFKNKFDWKGYISKYPDLHQANSFDAAWNHANTFGWKENRVVFDDEDLNYKFIYFKTHKKMPIDIIHKETQIIPNEITIKPYIYFIISHKNSQEHIVSSYIGHNIDNVKYILYNDIGKYNFNSDDFLVYMNSNHILDLSINTNKIAWLYKWDEDWIKSLDKYDYVLTGTNKMKLFIESKYNVKCYNFSISCNLCETFNNDIPHYDVLFDVSEYDQYNDYIVKFIRDNNDMKIKIIGNKWLNFVTSNTEKEFLNNYYSDVCINDELDEIYKNSKIIIDLSDEKYLKYGCASNKITRAISNKKVIITNNNESSKEIFENKLVTFSSYEQMITHIRNYLHDNNRYTINVNNLYNYGKLLLDNIKMTNSLKCITFFQKNDVKNDIIIKICGRGQLNFTFTDCAMWGDLYMANNISKQLESRYGIICQICLINDWYNYAMYNCNNILFLRGISIYNPRPENNNMVLFISHPETYTDEEFKKYNKIICCSKIFYEKIKNNLKLSNDDIIFALQPIDIHDNIETETKIVYDAVFIGNKMRERESVKWLTNDNFNRVKIFGDMWENKNINPIIQNIKSIDNCDVFDIYCKSKIILNDTWKDMRDNGFINNRVLEALTSGNFIITDNVKGIEDLKFANIYTFTDANNVNETFKCLINKSIDHKQKQKNITILKQNNLKLNKFVCTFFKYDIREPFVKYYTHFYDKKKLLNGKNELISYSDIMYKLQNCSNINLNIVSRDKKFYIDNNLKEKTPHSVIEYANLFKYIKKYHGDNEFINNLKNQYFFTQGKHTTINELIDNIKDIQKSTKNKKLVYTNNINSYDTFWDIQDSLKENDTDYIYISNVHDEKVCKNFKYIYCNLDSNDHFYKNRIIKFNKQLFNCYDKVMYIDANVKINNKLYTLFDMLDDKTDFVLVPHPERDILKQEVDKLLNAKLTHIKHNINAELLTKFKSDFKYSMSNSLYWLNVQISNTKHDIYSIINDNYKKYKFMRDQLYFPVIANNFNIKTINIKKPLWNATSIIYNLNDIKMNDYDYGEIPGLTEYLSRPFGGTHL